MVEYALFFKGVGVMILLIALFSGIIYWIVVGFKKAFPDAKYWLKYKFFRKKYNQEEIAHLMLDINNNVNIEDFSKTILLSNKVSLSKAKELIYLYKQLKKMKGGYIK